uniref:NADH-ubiquinone oxidoreductase chain 4 n=1 Tax=Eurytrema pancreaticum TaxID=374591 RepID=A0A0E3Y581_EUTPN|nr:NADH dehydrogenase subunit 4 [Eurytrema pancreaticum]
MGFKWFDGYSWGVSFLVTLVLMLLLCVCVSPMVDYCGLSAVSGFLCFDTVSFYLIILSSLLVLSLLFFVKDLSSVSLVMLILSVVCSVLSYCCVNSFWFWCFYELSILSLLLLLIVESPYSERYVASWYLLGYSVLSSLPMLLCLVYLSLRLGTFNFGCWSLWEGGSVDCVVLVVLGVLFIVKVPLTPFHVWLPLVHAEATSPVSVCLSGYVMKLGILGLCRICSWVLPDFVFTVPYLVVCLVSSFLFFFGACCELDGKRWLAFMSLSHIVIACVCLGEFEYEGVGLCLLYCLGHGLSAAVTFIFLWVSYEITGSRNWLVLKSVVWSGPLFSCIGVFCLCSVMSFPPTVQFFCEVYAVVKSFWFSGLLFFLLGLYLFISGLVPLFLICVFLVRHISLRCCVGEVFGLIVPIVFLLCWCVILFLVG